MAINEAVNIDIDVNGTSTVKQAADAYEDLGDAVSQTQLEAEKLAQQFGINDKRTQEAIKVAGKYKQEMEELDFAIDAARGGSDQLFRAAQGVTAGFEVAAGATALFGGQSEELEKVMLKVQGAMVLSQGLKDFKEFTPAILNLAKGIRTKLVTALTTLKGAIAATGIGLLLTGLATVVAYWDDIKAAVTGVSSSQKDLLKSQEDSAALAQEQLNSVSQQENILKLQGKTEEEIRQIKINRAKIAISELKAQIATQEQIKKTQIETAKRNKEIVTGIIEFLSKPINLLLQGVDKLKNAFGGNSNLAKQFKEAQKEAANFVFDPKETAKEADESINETKKQLNKLENTLAGFRLQQRAKRKENAQKAKDDDQKEFDDWLAKEIEKNEIQKANSKYAEDIRKKQQEDEDKAFQTWLDGEVKKAEIADANLKYKEKREQEARDKKKAEEQALADFEEKLFQDSQALGSAVIDLIGKETKVGKGLALAQIAADTARALSGALANANSPTPDNVASGGLAGIAKYIALATTIATNAKRAIDIVKGGNVSGAASGSAPTTGGGFTGSLNAPSIRLPRTEEFTGDRRVYVTEYDISNTQEKVKVTEDVSIVK
ncbi:hypothetical protein N9Z24_03715 [Gammaproteobacteria bacterium]|nr:hypothetical protein [Gammaproteobacteria bacterium]